MIGFLRDPKRGSGRFDLLQCRLQIASRRCKTCQSILPQMDKDKAAKLNTRMYELVFRIVLQGVLTKCPLQISKQSTRVSQFTVHAVLILFNNICEQQLDLNVIGCTLVIN